MQQVGGRGVSRRQLHHLRQRSNYSASSWSLRSSLSFRTDPLTGAVTLHLLDFNNLDLPQLCNRRQLDIHLTPKSVTHTKREC